jgi:hypothetical protein
LLVPPLSASTNEVPGGIGSSTSTLDGGGGDAFGGHCALGKPCGVSHGRPKFGPPLQIPVGFERQKPFSGRAVAVEGWQTEESPSVPSALAQFAPSLAALRQKKPDCESPSQDGLPALAAVPQYAFSLKARLQRKVMPGHSVERLPSATEHGRPMLGPPLHTPAPAVQIVGSATGGVPTPQFVPLFPELAQTKPPDPLPTQDGAGLLQVTGNVAHSEGGLKHVGAVGIGAD